MGLAVYEVALKCLCAFGCGVFLGALLAGGDSEDDEDVGKDK